MRIVEKIVTRIKDYWKPYYPKDYPEDVGLVGYTDPHNYIISVRPPHYNDDLAIGVIEMYNSNIIFHADKKARISIWDSVYIPEPFSWTNKNKWYLNQEEINELIIFLKTPSIFKPEFTNWELLIREYNDQSFSCSDELPLDFQMPDYSKIYRV